MIIFLLLFNLLSLLPAAASFNIMFWKRSGTEEGAMSVWTQKHQYHNGNEVIHLTTRGETCLRKVTDWKQQEEGETEEEVVDNLSDVLNKDLPVEDATNRVLKKSESGSPIRIWDKKVVTYMVMNTPKCSEISNRRIGELIKEAANTWNQIEANLVLKDIEQLMEDTNDIYSDDDIDIKIYFYPCHHNQLTNVAGDRDFEDCPNLFAHAFYPTSGDIHLNSMMTWTDKYYGSMAEGSLIKPNLYSIVLHEFGHSLGLSHNTAVGSIMNHDFTGNRAFTRLQVAYTSKSVLKELYPVLPRCRDKYSSCESQDCNTMSLRPFCQKTCNICKECGPGVEDEYIKCTKDICNTLHSHLRLFCKKTCSLCDKPTGCGRPIVPHGKPLPQLDFYNIGELVVVSCNQGYEITDHSLHMHCTLDDTGLRGYWTNMDVNHCKLKYNPPANCYDIHQSCAILLMKRKRKCTQKKMKRICTKTCNLCSQKSNTNAVGRL